jgi:hypothetical protein
MRATRLLAAVAATIIAMTLLVPSVAASSHKTRELHLTKECSAFTGKAGGFCTFTSSNIRGIHPGSKVFYLSDAGATNLDTDVVIRSGHGTTARGHCFLDFATGVGECNFWKGTGKLAGFQAHVVVSFISGPNWAWDGTYRLHRHHCHRGHH